VKVEELDEGALIDVALHGHIGLGGELTYG
jgi:hypothetical protein